MSGRSKTLDEIAERAGVAIRRVNDADGCVALGCRAREELRRVEIGDVARVLCREHAREFVRREGI
mgnify:CR=1 FL=1